MAMKREQTLCVQLERLRALLTLLAVVPDGRRRDELVQRTHDAIADIRKMRTALGANEDDASDADQPEPSRGRHVSDRASCGGVSTRNSTSAA